MQSALGRDLEAVDEDGDSLDGGEHDSSDYEPSLGAPVGSLHHHDMWRHNSLSAFEDEIDWENEEDERGLPDSARIHVASWWRHERRSEGRGASQHR